MGFYKENIELSSVVSYTIFTYIFTFCQFQKTSDIFLHLCYLILIYQDTLEIMVNC
ncbi:hypothetical protein X975_18754, partial [Stegodyphus mimosarum]